MATERSERELNQDINAAIAGTEDEIFREALEAELDDNDGDTSLEEMGEGLEGDHLDEDDIEVDEGEKPEEDEEEEESEEEDETGEAEDEEEDEEVEQPRDERGKFDTREPRIPPARLRAEAERARDAEKLAREAEQRVAILEARLQDLTQRVNQPPPAPKVEQQPAPKPDMFAEPEKYEQWLLDNAERKAMERLEARLADRDRQTQEQNNRRVDESLSTAAKGERSFEFQAAYNRLTSLDPKDPQARSTVQRIYNAPDPAKALFDWWDENGAEEYREQIARQLGFTQERSNQRRAPAREERQQPRHEYRGPRPMRSLNSASGSSSNRVSDPDMLDGSESSVFDYATRR